VAAAKEAATAETSVAAMAATTPLANEAEATAGEVAAAAEGSAATPAKAATATTSLSRHNPRVSFFLLLNSRSHQKGCKMFPNVKPKML
jgi:hypothetical protein